MPGVVATPLSYLMKVFPLDMSQCPNLFQSTRIPKVDGRDEIRERTCDDGITAILGQNDRFFSGS